MKIRYKGTAGISSKGYQFSQDNAEQEVTAEVGKYLLSTFGDKFEEIKVAKKAEPKTTPKKRVPKKED